METAKTARVMNQGEGVLLSPTQNLSGVTLIEMMVASCIFALLLAGFVTGFTFSRKAARAASDYMQAVHLSRQGIETLVDTSYSSFTNGTFSIPNLGMSNTYTVSQNPTYSAVKDITFTVYWTNPARATMMSMSYSTSVTSYLHQ